MLPQAYCVHRTSGRFRVRVPAAKGDRALLRSMQEGLSRCDAVSAVHGNPLTGSLLVIHAGDFSAVGQFAADNGIFTLAPQGQAATFARTTVSTFRKVNSRVKRLTAGELGVADAVVVTLLGTGLVQLARGRLSVPPWHTAFWYALSIFLKAHGKGSQRE